MSSIMRVIRAINIEPLFFLYYFSSFLTIPTKSALWYWKVCMTLYDNDWICANLNQNDSLIELEDQVQVINSQWNFYDYICYAIPSLLLTFCYGSWSDHISRKIPIMLPLIGNIIQNVLYIFAAKNIQSPYGFMLLINFIAGICGGSATFFMAAISYQSHVTPQKSRTFRISIVYGCLNVGSFMGALLSGIMLEKTGFTFVYCVAIITTSISLIYVIFGIKDVKKDSLVANSIYAQNTQSSETQKEKDDKKGGTERTEEVKKSSDSKEENDNKEGYNHNNEVKNANSSFCSFQHVKEPVLVAFRKRMYNHRVHILAILLCNGLHSLLNADFHVSYLYLKHPPLSFTQAQYGYYVAYGFVLGCTCLLVVVPIVKKRFQVADSILYALVLGSIALDMLIMGLSLSSWMVWLAPIAGYMGSGLWTFSRSMLSTMVEVDEIGKIFAVLSSFQAVCTIGGSFLYNYLLYPNTVDFFAGFSYIFSAIAFTLPLCIAIWLHFDLKKQKKLGSQGKVQKLDVYRVIEPTYITTATEERSFESENASTMATEYEY